VDPSVYEALAVGQHGLHGEHAPTAHLSWDRLAEICGPVPVEGQLVDVEGRLQTRQRDDDAGKRHLKAPTAGNHFDRSSVEGE
jgi:hypothetical protein